MAISLPTEKSRLSSLRPPRDQMDLSFPLVSAYREAVPRVDHFEYSQPHHIRDEDHTPLRATDDAPEPPGKLTARADLSTRPTPHPKAQTYPVDPSLRAYEALQVFHEERRNAGI